MRNFTWAFFVSELAAYATLSGARKAVQVTPVTSLALIPLAVHSRLLMT
jgi:hypothetical protein